MLCLRSAELSKRVWLLCSVCVCVCVCGGGGGGGGGHGGSLIFSYIRRLGSFLGVRNFEFRYIWGFSEK